MSLSKVLESKRAFRRNLAARPIAEKLRILDALRERELLLRGQGRDQASEHKQHFDNEETKERRKTGGNAEKLRG